MSSGRTTIIGKLTTLSQELRALFDEARVRISAGDADLRSAWDQLHVAHDKLEDVIVLAIEGLQDDPAFDEQAATTSVLDGWLELAPELGALVRRVLPADQPPPPQSVATGLPSAQATQHSREEELDRVIDTVQRFRGALSGSIGAPR